MILAVALSLFAVVVLSLSSLAAHPQ